MAEELKIMQKVFDMMQYGYGALAQYPKSEKFALCTDIKRCMDTMLERTIEAQKKYYKKTTLQDLDVEVAKLRAYLRLSHELGFLPMKKYEVWSGIPTEVQLRELGRPLDDADMMWFFERAIRCDGRPLGLPLHCTDVTTAERIAGRGMQVGSLVSQMTANVVMTPADHYIKRELCAPYYARYMDDMGAIIEGKAAAWELVEEVDNYLQTNLGLNLNQKTAVIPIGNPVEFVGRKISPVKIELRRQITLGMKKHLRYVQDAYAAGEIDLDYALSVITSYRGLFKDVTSDAFLEKMLDEFVLSRPALEA